MVHLPTLEAYRKYYRNHENILSLKYGGNWILINGGSHDPTVHSFDSYRKLNDYLKKDGEVIGRTVFTTYVPTGKELAKRKKQQESPLEILARQLSKLEQKKRQSKELKFIVGESGECSIQDSE